MFVSYCWSSVLENSGILGEFSLIWEALLGLNMSCQRYVSEFRLFSLSTTCLNLDGFGGP